MPGLGDNLSSVERITGHPRENFRSVILTRANDQELTMLRDSMDTPEYHYRDEGPSDPAAFSAILFANASFLNALDSAAAVAVTDHDEERVIGRLKYTSFDGLVLEFIVYTAADDTWLRMIAGKSFNPPRRFTFPPLGLCTRSST